MSCSIVAWISSESTLIADYNYRILCIWIKSERWSNKSNFHPVLDKRSLLIKSDWIYIFYRNSRKTCVTIVRENIYPQQDMVHAGGFATRSDWDKSQHKCCESRCYFSNGLSMSTASYVKQPECLKTFEMHLIL